MTPDSNFKRKLTHFALCINFSGAMALKIGNSFCCRRSLRRSQLLSKADKAASFAFQASRPRSKVMADASKRPELWLRHETKGQHSRRQQEEKTQLQLCTYVAMLHPLYL